MMTDSKSDEPEDLIEPLPGNNIYFEIRLWARDFYRVIVDEGAARVNHHV